MSAVAIQSGRQWGADACNLIHNGRCRSIPFVAPAARNRRRTVELDRPAAGRLAAQALEQRRQPMAKGACKGKFSD